MSIEARLQELQTLKDKNLISDAEFERERSKALSGSSSSLAPNAARVDSSELRIGEFKLENLQNPLGYAAAAFVFSMFLPWVDLYVASASGWSIGNAAELMSSWAYLVYLVPIGGGTVLYSLGNNRPIPIWTMFTGFVPGVLVMGATLKFMTELKGTGLADILFDSVLDHLSIGFYLAMASGIFMAVQINQLRSRLA